MRQIAIRALAALAVSALAVPASAQAESLLYRFTGGNDGRSPAISLIDAAGNLYGIALWGGSAACDRDCGTVFELLAPTGAKSAWSLKVLHAFAGGRDDGNPSGGLHAGPDGALYGTTADRSGRAGFDTVYRLTPPGRPDGTWKKQVLYRFAKQSDGAGPTGSLIADASGALYGTTTYGGTDNLGVVLRLNPPSATASAWTEQVLHSFSSNADGNNPMAGLAMDQAGNLYGTTQSGSRNFAAGTVFELVRPRVPAAKWQEKIIHRFAGSTDGSAPQAPVLMDHKGFLLGTTYWGGPSKFGTVFQLLPPEKSGGSWTEKILHSFRNKADGRGLENGVIAGPNGSYFGTTSDFPDATAYFGTVFKLTPPADGTGQWTETVLDNLPGGRSGAHPSGLIWSASSGVLYGSTYADSYTGLYGEDVGDGTVFKMNPGE